VVRPVHLGLLTREVIVVFYLIGVIVVIIVVLKLLGLY